MDCFNFSHFFERSSNNVKNIFEFQKDIWQALIDLSDNIKNQRLGKIEIDIPSNVTLINPELISIGKNTIVEQGAYIKGPCIIGENCEIRHCAYIRGNVIAGNGCIIGHCTEIKHSILLNNVHAAHFAYIGDSIIGNYVNLGAGVRCANFRIDKKNIKLTINGKIIDTQLNKFGSIIGDNVQIGCNTVLNPGTLIGKNSIFYPNVNCGGHVPSDSIIKSSNKVIITTKKVRKDALCYAVEKKCS